jgi:hypothetical protein
MDTKVALDMEIAVFRRLLESEEDRLGINIGGEQKQPTLASVTLGMFPKRGSLTGNRISFLVPKRRENSWLVHCSLTETFLADQNIP